MRFYIFMVWLATTASLGAVCAYGRKEQPLITTTDTPSTFTVLLSTSQSVSHHTETEFQDNEATAALSFHATTGGLVDEQYTEIRDESTTETELQDDKGITEQPLYTSTGDSVDEQYTDSRDELMAGTEFHVGEGITGQPMYATTGGSVYEQNPKSHDEPMTYSEIDDVTGPETPPNNIADEGLHSVGVSSGANTTEALLNSTSLDGAMVQDTLPVSATDRLNSTMFAADDDRNNSAPLINYNEYQSIPSGLRGESENQTFDNLLDSVLNRTFGIRTEAPSTPSITTLPSSTTTEASSIVDATKSVSTEATGAASVPTTTSKGNVSSECASNSSLQDPSLDSGCGKNDTGLKNYGQIMPIPYKNGTRLANFSSIIDLVKEHTEKNGNKSGVIFTGGITSPHHGNCSQSSRANTTKGLPVTEAKFQVSGMNSFVGSVDPWHGGSLPPLLIDNHSGAPRLVQNTSIVLKTVREVDEINNATFNTFSEAIDQVGTSSALQNVSRDVKKDLFTDIMAVAEFLFNNIADGHDNVHLNTATMENSFQIDIRSEYVTPPLVEVSHVTVYLDQPEVSVQLTTEIFIDDNSTRAGVRVSTVIYKEMDAFISASNDDISSDVMSVSVQKVKDNQTKSMPVQADDAIQFVMKTVVNQDKREVDRQCIFWDVTNSEWSSKGCSLVDKNDSYTMCTCNHLTNFAILVIYMDTDEVSLESQQVLFALTTVGCSISIACLATALIAYIYLQMLSNEKVLIHANLSAALLMAQLVFVSSGDAYKNPAICKIVAVLLHYFFMASFTWMMSEGLALYLFCTKGIFNLRGMRIKYFLLGWGLPALIVIISMAAKFPEYGNGPQYSCWLSVKDGLIWAFMGPMLAIVLLNIFVLGLVVRVFLTLKANSEKTEVVRLRGSIRAMFTLMPLLGLTWILSLLVPLSVVFHYFFVIINTVQGMCIFFLHCICNDELRKKFQEKRRRWSTSRTASDAEMSHHGRRKRGSFDAIKTAAVVTVPANDYARRSAWK